MGDEGRSVDAQLGVWAVGFDWTVGEVSVRLRYDEYAISCDDGVELILGVELVWSWCRVAISVVLNC